MNKKVVSGIWLIGIFVVGVIFHYYYGYFSKSIEVLPDEIRYYSIARSMFFGDGLLFRGEATDYQKIGYALYLMPWHPENEGYHLRKCYYYDGINISSLWNNEKTTYVSEGKVYLFNMLYNIS